VPRDQWSIKRFAIPSKRGAQFLQEKGFARSLTISVIILAFICLCLFVAVSLSQGWWCEFSQRVIRQRQWRCQRYIVDPSLIHHWYNLHARIRLRNLVLQAVQFLCTWHIVYYRWWIIYSSVIHRWYIVDPMLVHCRFNLFSHFRLRQQSRLKGLNRRLYLSPIVKKKLTCWCSLILVIAFHLVLQIVLCFVCDTLCIISVVNKRTEGHNYHECEENRQFFKFWFELNTLYILRVVKRAPQAPFLSVSPRCWDCCQYGAIKSESLLVSYVYLEASNTYLLIELNDFLNYTHLLILLFAGPVSLLFEHWVELVICECCAVGPIGIVFLTCLGCRRHWGLALRR